jgi:Ni,Fe-hydrogenase maturation factor
MEKLKILVFGNPLVREDSIALRLIAPLRKKFPEIEFKEFDTAENLEKEGRNLVILDSALGIGKVVLINSPGALGSGKIYSMHDFDLSITLKLLRKMGALDSVRIIAVPADCGLRKAAAEAAAVISSLLSENASRSSCTGRKRG